MVLRNLTQEEITRLQAQGCSSTDWQRVKVASGFKPDYIQKLKILMNNKKQKYKKIFGGADIKETSVKEYFLRWIFTNKKMILVRDKDEEFKGILESISEETVSIKVIDKITEKRNGYTVLLRSHIDYFSV